MSRWHRPGRGRRQHTAAVVAALGASAALLSGCGLVGNSGLQQDAPAVMTLTSPALFGRGSMPQRYTCHGSGQSPPLSWSTPPAGTKALAVVIDDAAAPITPYIYWIVFNIDPARSDIQAGQVPPGALQAKNSKGTAAYDPPCPPEGTQHSYRFTVYALNSMLNLKAGANLLPAWTAIAEHAIARGTITVTAG